MARRADVTLDGLFGGALELLQPARGYRVSIDSLLLADFAAKKPVRQLVDLGAGVGAIALAIDHLVGVGWAALVEREVSLAELARENLARAGLAGELFVVDLGSARLPKALVSRAELVVSNPPFFGEHAARPARDPLARAARFGELAPFLTATAKALSGVRARAAFCYPARSLAELLSAADRVGLVAKRLRLVHTTLAEPARLALVELRRARPGGLVVEPPLVEWRARGVRSAEISALLDRPRADRR